MPPRYFIGITPPKDVARVISSVQYSLYDEKLLLKPLVPHITIIHPNALERISPLWLLPKLKSVQAAIMPTSIKLGSISVFHTSNLHIKVESTSLNELYEQCLNLLPKDVIATHFVGKRKFDPHITLAQAKPKQELSPKYIELYRQQLKPIIGTQFTVNNLTKFEHSAPRHYQIKHI
jgi:2'-5' RNA ligase